jgi:hypothetical protein
VVTNQPYPYWIYWFVCPKLVAYDMHDVTGIDMYNKYWSALFRRADDAVIVIRTTTFMQHGLCSVIAVFIRNSCDQAEYLYHRVSARINTLKKLLRAMHTTLNELSLYVLQLTFKASFGGRTFLQLSDLYIDWLLKSVLCRRLDDTVDLSCCL